MTDECKFHQPAEGPCEPETHNAPSCPWCIVWRQKLLLERLLPVLSETHDVLTKTAQALIEVLYPRHQEVAGSSRSGHAKTGRAKRTRASKSTTPSTESEPVGSGGVSAASAVASDTSSPSTCPPTNEAGMAACAGPEAGT